MAMLAKSLPSILISFQWTSRPRRAVFGCQPATRPDLRRLMSHGPEPSCRLRLTRVSPVAVQPYFFSFSGLFGPRIFTCAPVESLEDLTGRSTEGHSSRLREITWPGLHLAILVAREPQKCNLKGPFWILLVSTKCLPQPE